MSTPSATGLRERAFSPLPLGQIRPTGWLLDQLRTQAAGLTGHLDEFWPPVARSGWIGGDLDSWENGPYWLDGLLPLAYLLDSAPLKAKASAWINAILDQQQADGWLGTVTDRLILPSRSVRPGRDAVGYRYDPWPRFVILKVLMQQYEATGDARVLSAMRRFVGRFDRLLAEDGLRSWARFRWPELMLAIDWLYEQTGEADLLPIAERAMRQGFDWTAHFANFPHRTRLNREECDLTSHGVNIAMAIKGPALWYRRTGDPADRARAARMIATLDCYHGQATGAFSCDEHLAGRSPTQGTELCTVVEYMFSLEVLLSILGDGGFADRLEALAYNALPATISPDMWTHQYDQQVNQVVCRVAEDRVYTTNGPHSNLFGLEPNYGCCAANMHQGWPKFAAALWMAAPDGGLAAMSYAPCVVSTAINDVPSRIEVKSDYPFGTDIEIIVTSAAPVSIPLSLRIPEWAVGATVAVGSREAGPVAAGGFHALRCECDGVVAIRLRLPATVRAERRYRDGVSLYRGPLLFGLEIGEEWRQVGADLGPGDWEIHPTTPWNYALVLDPANVAGAVAFDHLPVGSRPFSPAGAPVRATVAAKRVPQWWFEHNAAAAVPPSPVESDEPLDTVTLIPYGCTNLRVAEFPVTEPKG